MNEGIAQLITAILSDIEDSKRLKDHGCGPHTLHDLLVAYQTLAGYQKQLPPLTLESTGSELKEAIDRLEPDQAMVLLVRYAQRKDDAREDARPDSGASAPPQTTGMQTQIYVLAIALALFVLMGIAVAVLAVLVHLEIVTLDAVMQDMLETLRDALKALSGLD
ncbi:putative component of type VI protein secretion system [Paraburkholderia sp. GAS448]|uniref:hypothetical protein n=1 Tax=Paraburkholderia sp. GAS448 TaxID=3035136 RepID=UPI003D21082C